MGFPGELSDILTEHEPLSTHTCFSLGGPAQWLARPRDAGQLAALVRMAAEEGIGLHMLGLGANVLVGDEGVDGVVVRLEATEFRQVIWDAGDGLAAGAPVGCLTGARSWYAAGVLPAGGLVASPPRSSSGTSEETLVHVGAGADMNRLAREAVQRGLAGLEVMAGIPGTLGGIIRMNAGGRFGQIADVVHDVTVIDCDGRLRTLSREEVGFGYRRTGLGQAVICAATLVLHQSDPAALRKRFLDIWEFKKKSQPLADASAGCIFKNPPGGSAGELIDRAGLKNRRVGGAYVSSAHANFICAQEGATARDVISLIAVVWQEVADRFGVELELEIEVWGRAPGSFRFPIPDLVGIGLSEISNRESGI